MESQITKVIFVRHGETVWNLEGKAQGHLDSPLTDLGIRQAQAVARRLKSTAIDQIYSSDLGRCQQTAQIIAEVRNQDVILDTRLRERSLGVLQGLTSAESQAMYPDIIKNFRTFDPDYRVPEGETYTEIIQRAMSLMDDTAINHAGECILMVTHGALLSHLLKHLLGIPPEAPRRFHVRNTSINIALFESKYWSIETLGDISHFDDFDAGDEEHGG